jgi:hypothetical protein
MLRCDRQPPYYLAAVVVLAPAGERHGLTPRAGDPRFPDRESARYGLPVKMVINNSELAMIL